MSATPVARGVIAFAAAALMLTGPALANDAAHKLAEKFAHSSDSAKKEPVESRAADDKASKEKAEAAKKKAAARKAAQAKRRAAEAARRREAQRKAAEAQLEAKRRAADGARRATEQRKADETEMLARARREADDMRATEEQTRLAEEARRLIEEAGKERAKAEALLAEQADKERTKLTEDTRLAQQRMEETRRLAEKLRRVRQIHDARIAAQASKKQANDAPAVAAVPPAPTTAVVPPSAEPQNPEAGTQMPPAAPAQAPAPVATAPTVQPKEVAPPPTVAAPADPVPSATSSVAAAPSPPPVPSAVIEEASQKLPPQQPAAPPAHASETHFAVLLILEPGSYGIRRNGPRTADPVLCVPGGCYVSAGADQPAMFLRGHKALGFGNTLGARAGACRNSLGCVFRDVELSTLPAYLQPVDLHILRHDRRAPHTVLGNSNCRSTAGHLTCSRGIYAGDYTLWIVPESLADVIGPAVLESAVDEGLNGPRSAELSPQR